jgi:hypothetical protein
MIKMRPPAVSRDVESVDTHSRATRPCAEGGAAYAARIALVEKKAPKVVIPDESHRFDPQFGIEALEVERHVRSRPAVLAIDRQNLV